MRLHEVIHRSKIRRTGRSVWHYTDRYDTDITCITDPEEDQWMATDFYLNVIGPDRNDLNATDWEFQITAEERLQYRIHDMVVATGICPNVLDVSESDWEVLRAGNDKWRGMYKCEFVSPHGVTRIMPAGGE